MFPIWLYVLGVHASWSLLRRIGTCHNIRVGRLWPLCLGEEARIHPDIVTAGSLIATSPVSKLVRVVQCPVLRIQRGVQRYWAPLGAVPDDHDHGRWCRLALGPSFTLTPGADLVRHNALARLHRSDLPPPCFPLDLPVAPDCGPRRSRPTISGATTSTGSEPGQY